MNYNPVNDRSAEILTSANNQAAAIQLRGMENLGNSLAEMGKSYGDAFYKNAAKARENAAKADTNLGTAEAIDSIYGTYGTPEQRQAFREGLNKMSGNQDKASGFIAMHVQTADALMKMATQNNQYTKAIELAKQKQALGLGGGGSTPMYGVEIADGVDIYR